MAYQNAFFDRSKNTMYVWDDRQGILQFPYRKYAYTKDPNGPHVSIYGDRLRKISKWTKEEAADLFESDVPETTRTLVDMYDSELPSEGHTTLIFDIEVEMNSGLPNTELAENTITAIAAHDNTTNTYEAFILDEKGIGNPDIDFNSENRITKVNFFDNEENLLLAFLNYWESVSPTIVSGWNIDYFDIPYLVNRIINVLGREHASRLSTIGIVHYSEYGNRWKIAGVSILDYLNLYKNYTYTLEASYQLNAIATKELGRGKLEYDGNLDILFETDIHKFIEYNLVDVELVVELDNKLKFIELCQAICHAGFVPYEDYRFSSKFLDGACLAYAKRLGKVTPNKPKDRKKRMEALKNDKAEKFIGAYVKEPIPGKYEWIYDLDLTSLYPSIIMSLNISPETKVGKVTNWDVEKWASGKLTTMVLQSNDKSKTYEYNKEEFEDLLKSNNLSISANGILYTQAQPGIIADILNTWFSQRKDYQALEKKYGKEGDKAKHEFYGKRQLVQKILLNSMYGVLGLPVFRFYDLDNAEAVTLTGQLVIKKTADMANLKYNKELNPNGETVDYNVYIDTDSIFMLSLPILKNRIENFESLSPEEIAKEVNKLANEVQEYLNSFYDVMSERLFFVSKDKHRFEIKTEYVSSSGFWVSKKRYAHEMVLKKGLPISDIDVKGLDVVRSSFPKAFGEFMKELLRDIMADKGKEYIDNKIYQFRKKVLRESPIHDIAKRGAIKELSKYDSIEWSKGQAINNFVKSTPAHVKAGIAYNRLLKFFDVPYKYEPIRDGDKVQWVYLKMNPLGLTEVAFKGYNDPEEILNFIENYIDREMIYEAELENKLGDFYKALKWGIAAPELENSNKFFSF